MKRKLALTIATAVAAVTAALVTVPAFADEAAQPNDDPNTINVYNANVENLPKVSDKCPGDWQDLIYYMKAQDTLPDIYIVHQLSGTGHDRGELGFLLDRMSKEFGHTYDGVVADKKPGPAPKKCAPAKGRQTNAIIFRKDRFDVETKKSTWLAQAEVNGKCVNSDQDRTRGLKLKLRDKVANKTVGVGSAHWPTKSAGGRPCVQENSAEITAEMKEKKYRGDLTLLGSDMNHTDVSDGEFLPWYSALNGDRDGRHGWRDAMYTSCAATDAPKKCLKDNWTIPSSDRRIDMLLTKKGDGSLPKVSSVATPTWNQGDKADERFTGSDNGKYGYSDHRAVRARIHY